MPPLHLLLLVPTLQSAPSAPTEAEVVAHYADFAEALYARLEERARELSTSLEELVRDPRPETLAAARAAWLSGRREYGWSEVLRFYGGPIDSTRDGVETYLNAWPLDEAYIDYVEGAPDAGIVQDPDTYPVLDPALLVLLNERGGEKNVCIGWHAIEFLLWGQDLDPDGPGRRSHEDYVVGAHPHAERRGQLLLACAELLVEHHRQVRVAWQAGSGRYREEFLALPADRSLRRILAGMVVLSGFEMSGERLAVAYETRDQEEEHSCFSDNTHVDFLADQEGILAVWTGEAPWEGGPLGPGMRELARRADPALAETLDQHLALALAAVRSLPVPFDRALTAPDDSPERQAVLAALVALERQSETLALLGYTLGFDIAIHPGG